MKKSLRNTEDLISLYPDRFEGQGCFSGTVKLELKDDSEPVVQAPRHCPTRLNDEIQAELDKMEQQGIIEKIPQGHPTERLSSLAYAHKKDKSLRVCLDHRLLNEVLKRTHH